MTIPPYYPFGDGALFTNQACTANFTSNSFSVGEYTSLSFMINWSSFNSNSSVVQVQVSNNNSSWDDKSSASATLIGASGAQGLSLAGTVTEGFYRLKYTKNSNSAGIASCYVIGKF